MGGLSAYTYKDILKYYDIECTSVPNEIGTRTISIEYKGKKIPGPGIESLYIVCKECFGIDIEALKIKEYKTELSEKSGYNKFKI